MVLPNSRSSARDPERKGLLKILLVDPKPQSRSILKGSLLSLDNVHAVIERGSTKNLEQVLDKEFVHLVMLDQDLGDGIHTLDVIRSLQILTSAKKTRFIIVEQQQDDELRREASELGVTGFLTKPYDLQSLQATLREGLGRNAPEVSEGDSGASGNPPSPTSQARLSVPKDVLERLKRIPVFAEFTDEQLVRLLKICQLHRIPGGEYVFREGDSGDRLYVLISGQVNIQRARGQESRILDSMRPGDCFGEMAIIDSGPRSADAFAFSDVTVIEIMRETVNKDEDAIALKLVRQLAILLTRKIRVLVANR